MGNVNAALHKSNAARIKKILGTIYKYIAINGLFYEIRVADIYRKK